MWSAVDVLAPAGVRRPSSGPTRLVDRQGAARPWPVDRWVAPPDAFERQLLDRVRGPAIDLGCGPGRHVLDLQARGIRALGVDSDPEVLALAVGRGAAVIEADVFGPLPGEGTWATALLLDGSVGMGADPESLLRRVRSLVAADGCALVELEPPGTGLRTDRFRIEGPRRASPWFTWSTVSTDVVHAIARSSGWRVTRLTTGHGRWFATLTA